jgi:hypothetical protein
MTIDQYIQNINAAYKRGIVLDGKWLKDRKECKLEFDDIAHYQKIIVALTETSRLMEAIDKIE